jgi:hypothetical protein
VGSIPSASSNVPVLESTEIHHRPVRCLYAPHVLTSREQSIVDFERSWWLIPGPKDQAIREHLGMSATQYYRILRALVERQDARDYDPLTIRRLQRLRSKRRRGGGRAVEVDDG